MTLMKLASHTLLLTTMLVLRAGIVQATLVSPGSPVFPGLFNANQDVTLLADDVNVPWLLGSGAAASHGTYTDAVYRNTSGTLDFVYQFTNASTSHVGIEDVTAFDFGTATTDVGFVANGGSLPGGIFVNGSIVPGIPEIITRSIDASTIGFAFNVFPVDNIPPGVTSAVLMVSTNAQTFTGSGAGGAIIASGAFNISGFQPNTIVPEPSSQVPLAGMFLVVGGVAMRRRRRAQV